MKSIPDGVAYALVVDAFRKRKDGATIADIVASSAIPLEKVRELAPAVSDEFGARLRVTESGEILYSFPDGFKSRYHGFGPTMKRTLAMLKKGTAFVAKALFKVWIVVMLVGYFALFMGIALVALLASVAVSASGSSDSRSSSRRGGGLGGLYLASRVFDLVIRIWFYSELTKSFDNSRYGGRGFGRGQQAAPKRPLHHAVFSFVFGDGDPNADWPIREKKAVIAYIQANRGVISLPEFMVLTGLTPREAELAIMPYLTGYGGMPEATEDGTVVYRFDDLLLRSDSKDRSTGLAAPIKRLKTFSSNTKKMNTWFAVLNGVNLLFGSYFLACAIGVGPITQQAQITGSTYLYAVALVLFSALGNPVIFTLVLGIIPILFAALFYSVPLIRAFREKTENERIKNENLRKEAYKRLWDEPNKISAKDIKPSAAECTPSDLAKAKERVFVEFGSYAMPELLVGEKGDTEYSFPSLAEEKEALARYRGKIDSAKSELGSTVFDSHQ